MTPDDEAPHRHRWAYPLDIPDPIRTCKCGAVQYWGPATKGTKTPDDEAQRIAHEFRLEFGSPCGMHHCGRCLDLATRIRELVNDSGARAVKPYRAEIAQLRAALQKASYYVPPGFRTILDEIDRLLKREGEK